MTEFVRTPYYHVLVCLAFLFSALILIGCGSNKAAAIPQTKVMKMPIKPPIEIEPMAIPSKGAMRLIWMNPSITDITSFNISWVGPTAGSAQKNNQTMPGGKGGVRHYRS